MMRSPFEINEAETVYAPQPTQPFMFLLSVQVRYGKKRRCGNDDKTRRCGNLQSIFKVLIRLQYGAYGDGKFQYGIIYITTCGTTHVFIFDVICDVNNTANRVPEVF